MKSFIEWCNDYCDSNSTYPTPHGCYNAGATEARKSIRCETCLGWKNEEGVTIKGVRFAKCINIHSLVANDFGCVKHEERKVNG